jgi:deoxyribodipyrimidine photolyase-related protein
VAVGVWVLPDQLHAGQAALASLPVGRGPVLLLESEASLRERPHRQKQILFWSAQRHFAAELTAAGHRVDLVEARSAAEALPTWVRRHRLDELHLMEPADRPARRAIEGLDLPCRLVWHPDNHFLWSREAFGRWAEGRRQLRMEFFYREGRRRFGVLLQDGQPVGGRWNYDSENRRPPARGLRAPEPLGFAADAITTAVIDKVDRMAEDVPLPGLSQPFRWAVTRCQALAVLEQFLQERLDDFGPWQDVMVSGEPSLWHARLSPYLNLGLLRPDEVLRRLEATAAERAVPLASLEGCVRQILGWREFTHGLYHHFGPTYPGLNALEARQPLPGFLWELGGSGMACVDTVLGELAATGYNHHIQRLMVLSNLALIAGWDPQATSAWFRAHYLDAHDWVMQTNVLGMGLWADGGRLASKPYAASGAYIKKMSTYCAGCRFDPKQRTGPRACPYTSLYWGFLDRHAERFRNHPRMALMVRQLDRLSAAERSGVREACAALEWGSAPDDSGPAEPSA